MANERKIDMEVRRQELEAAERARSEENKIRREELKTMNMFMMQMICNNVSVMALVSLFCFTTHTFFSDSFAPFLDSNNMVLVIMTVICDCEWEVTTMMTTLQDTTLVIMVVVRNREWVATMMTTLQDTTLVIMVVVRNREWVATMKMAT